MFLETYIKPVDILKALAKFFKVWQSLKAKTRKGRSKFIGWHY